MARVQWFSILCVLFVIFQILGVTGFEIPCNLSTSTIEIVEQCPTDKQTYVEAAARKNCSAIDNSCDSFVYHCVFNVWRNATLEVCAPWLIIVGQVCAEYSEGFMSIRETEVSCRNFSKPCPTRYNSTDQYEYPECYDIVYKSSPPDTTPKVPLSEINTTTPQEEGGLSVGVGIAVGLIIIILIMIVAVFMYVIRKMKTQNMKSKKAFAAVPLCGRCLAEGCTCIMLKIQNFMDNRYGNSTSQEGVSPTALPLNSHDETIPKEQVTPDASSSIPLLSNFNDDMQNDLGAHKTDTNPNVENQDDNVASVCDSEVSSIKPSPNQNKSKDLTSSATRNEESIQQSSTSQQLCHVQPSDLSPHQHTENAPSVSTSDIQHKSPPQIQQIKNSQEIGGSACISQNNQTSSSRSNLGDNGNPGTAQPDSPEGSSTLVPAGAPLPKLAKDIKLEAADTPVKAVPKENKSGAFSKRIRNSREDQASLIGSIELDGSGDVREVNQLISEPSFSTRPDSGSGASTEDFIRNEELEKIIDQKLEKRDQRFLCSLNNATEENRKALNNAAEKLQKATEKLIKAQTTIQELNEQILAKDQKLKNKDMELEKKNQLERENVELKQRVRELEEMKKIWNDEKTKLQDKIIKLQQAD
ncbi:uncharacterized protein LOC125674697 isoform X3 [Ostrea edulis]|uniref:uncharacterized protein LOC125674697 isoform X3 n=1 Tax=Ostrea edulis TaxID=37623 RepID=UPI0024AEDDED|nr:uncharacterized protein LOC125674697 isoform X3 [Ostrea edulis]